MRWPLPGPACGGSHSNPRVLSQAYIIIRTKETLSEGVRRLYHFQGVPSPVVLAFAPHVILSLTSGARTTTGQVAMYNTYNSSNSKHVTINVHILQYA